MAQQRNDDDIQFARQFWKYVDIFQTARNISDHRLSLDIGKPSNYILRSKKNDTLVTVAVLSQIAKVLECTAGDLVFGPGSDDQDDELVILVQNMDPATRKTARRLLKTLIESS